MSKVEWKKFGDVCDILDSQRKPVAKGNRSHGVYPYYGANGIQDYVDDYIFDGTYLLLGEDGSVINKDNSPVLHWATGKIWVNNHAHILKENDKALLRYLYYALQCTDVSDIVRGMPPKLNQANMRTILIPIPSISEQNRIVEILDTFTASIDNLKEQIAQRRKQYEYYRDQLLNLEGKEGVEMKTCGSYCEVTDYVANGSFATLRENVSYKQEPDYAILVRTTDLSNNFKGDKIYIDERAYSFLSKSSLFGGEIIINNIGAGVGQTFKCPYLKERMSLGPNSILVRTPNNDFFYYYFNSIYGQNAMMKVVTPGAMPKFNKTGFKSITIPVPTLQEQQRIVDILDKFEASIQNLEAQLSEREKQYEYYRNKLLTFE